MSQPTTIILIVVYQSVTTFFADCFIIAFNPTLQNLRTTPFQLNYHVGPF